jgi:hypothetical protein
MIVTLKKIVFLTKMDDSQKIKINKKMTQTRMCLYLDVIIKRGLLYLLACVVQKSFGKPLKLWLQKCEL